MTGKGSSDNDSQLVRPDGFEPPTPALGGPRSVLLSYGRKVEGLTSKGCLITLSQDLPPAPSGAGFG